jgi:alpha-galactosidase
MRRGVRIDGPGRSLILLLPDRGMPTIGAFCVPRLPHDVDLTSLPYLVRRSSRINGMDAPPPSAVLLPTGGLGSFQWPAIAGHRDGRHFTLEPGDWQVEGTASRTQLVGTDPHSGLTVTIDLAFSPADVLTMRTSVTNTAAGVFDLDRCMAGTMLAPADATEALTFDGGWGREFHEKREALGSSIFLKENRRGRTSHDRHPSIILGRPGFGDAGGAVFGLHLGFSGNHIIAVDRLDDGRRLVHAGELFEPGEIRLAKDETYASPTAHIAVAANLTAMSQAFQTHVRDTIMKWPDGAMRPRPVTLNTWEGNYFALDPVSLMAQAEAAAKLGIERFVLDDGWFGRRNDDTSSLGDWFIDERKFPKGLKPLADHVIDQGMEFGIWFEPEMVNPDSNLLRAHPDWALQIEGRPLLLSRNQLVLDLTRTDVADYLFERVDELLSSVRIAYIKWDMNRDLTHVGDAAGRAATARQTRAFYALVDRIRAAHPQVEIESCSSGGGRADYGVLSRTHRIWTSDCTDALERQTIQRGASLFFPPEILGAHISASPNHQTHRRHSLSFRALTALPYHFGVELNPLELSRTERAEVRGWIALHKRLRTALHSGRAIYRDAGDGRLVHYVLDETGATQFVFIAQMTYGLAEQAAPLIIEGLDPDGAYRLSLPGPQEPEFFRHTAEQASMLRGGIALSGALLSEIGLPIPAMRPESALLIEITRTRKGR